MTTAYVIGDPHFRNGVLKEGEEFLRRCVAKAKQCEPTFIVCLGDILHTHETTHSQSYNLAVRFIQSLSDIAPTYLLIGNHDYINNQQFLTDAHFFNPLKGQPNITIVDTPTYASYGDQSFVFVPYVPPGRFIEALNRITEQGEAWDVCDAIFAHQEFLGCKMGAIQSLQGDEYDESYPPVISGHIHDAQELGNIYYPGSAIQHAYGESPDKRVWLVTFGTDDPPYFDIKKFNLGMKGKKMVYMSLDDVETFDFDVLKKYHVKLSLKGTTEGFKVFRRGSFYTKLTKAGVKIAYSPIAVERETLSRSTREETSYRGMLRQLVKERSAEVQAVYNELLEDSVATESDDEDEDEGDECDEDDEECDDNEDACNDEEDECDDDEDEERCQLIFDD